MQKNVVVVLLGLLIAACEQPQPVDLLITNAHIYTLDSSFSVAQAMAIRKGKIVAVGSSADVTSGYQPAEVVDAQGQFIYPAFNDAHCHYVGYALGLTKVNLVGTRSWAEVLERLETFVKAKKPSFIVGRGWDQNDWEVKAFPTKKELDSLYPNTPVVLKRIDGHAALVNQAAFNFAKITSVPAVEGGLVVTDASGAPTGLLIDNAVGLVPIPKLSREKKVETLLAAQEKIHAVGLASLTDAGLLKEDILLLDSLQQAGDLKLRINAMVSDDSASLNYFLSQGGIENNWLRVKSAKFYLDGALGSRGALLLKPYADDTANYGLQLIPATYFKSWAQKLAPKDWQMCVHAIGDSANRLAIEVFAAALKGDTNARWRLEHAQIMTSEDINKMVAANILPSIQPTHATSDMYWAGQRLGAKRLATAYRAQSYQSAGAITPLGTDFPVEDINPLNTLRAAVYRQDDSGYPDTAFFARERLSPEEALRGMTQYGAYASFEENFKGKLQPGYLADFVLFDTDILKATLAQLEALKPKATFVNGQKVFEAP
jgi:predicted amidohydrolase YtcJ